MIARRTNARYAIVLVAACCLLVGLWPHVLVAQVGKAEPETSSERDLRLIDARLEAMSAASPGAPALYVLGLAGDGGENVFRNEVAYLQTLMAQRFGARLTLGLVNHPESLDARRQPLATLPNLRHALAGISAAMDSEHDLLLLYLTSHGSEDHQLSLAMPGRFTGSIRPQQLRDALDDAGIGNRIVVISACFSGGFVAALQEPRTLIMTAARHDRSSFGCGVHSSVTWFGRAWLVEALNQDDGMIAAFDHARRSVLRRERRQGFRSSQPQLSVGNDIHQALQAWESTRVLGPVVAYPYPLD